MKSKKDLLFEDTAGPATAPSTWFEKLWREAEEREKRQVNADLAHRRVRLACAADLVDIGSVGLVVSRQSAPGAVLIEFVCPRCGELHDSRLFP